ncbi:MAG: hypothetical protein K2I08_10365 [Muribaculaceae bacterium]|nr:hypothetical protein [Muribaculaceae bacterium]
MVFTIESLQKEVMARLGEIAMARPSLPALGVPTSADIVAAKIESMLPEEGAKLIRGASAGELGSGIQMEVTVGDHKLMPCGLYAAEIELPEDFLRLVSLKMSGWEKSVSSLILPTSPEWDCQWSPEPGIAGCRQRPRGYWDGKLLRAICSQENDILESLYGWRIPVTDTDGNFEFPPIIYPDLIGAIESRIVSG